MNTPRSLVLALLLASPAGLGAAPPLAADVSRYITSSGDRPPKRPAWKGPLPGLESSPLNHYASGRCGVDNERAIANLLAFLKTHPINEYALAIVPGSSEARCHHCSWTRADDPHWVEPNFRSRLRHAFLLLQEGVVHSAFISGGPIDKDHPEYDEAVFGFREMVSEYSGRFHPAGGSKYKLADRIVVEPWAIHSEVNIRNGDRLTRLLGLDRSLVVTEVGSIKRQGWYFVHHGAPLAFDHRAGGQFGYRLGEFEELGVAPVFKRYAPKSMPDRLGVRPAQYLNSAGSHPEIEYIPKGVDTAAIAHWKLRSANELFDHQPGRWDFGAKEIADLAKDPKWMPLVPNQDALGKACATLKRH